MYNNRYRENGEPPPRSSRIFTMENVCYFSTREGADIGPFNSHKESNNGWQDFLQFIQLANDKIRREFLRVLNARGRQSLYR